MGTVYVGEHELLSRFAAIKVLRPELTLAEDMVQRFFNEARAVAQISDPGIVRVYDFGYAPSGAYLVMEILDGEPMDRILSHQGPFELRATLQLVRFIATSLAAAHAKGIIHRDLKPANIFHRPRRRHARQAPAQVLDFGIAKLMNDDSGRALTRHGAVIGTPAFMPPEQFHNASAVDQRSDVYSLGCVMYTMLTGRSLFDGSTLPEQIAAHLMTPAPSLLAIRPTTPRAVDDIIQRCVAKSPADRFPSMTDLVDALDGIERTLSGSGESDISAATVPARPMPAELASQLPASQTLTDANGQVLVTKRGAPWRAIAIAVAIVAIVAVGSIAIVATTAAHDREPAQPAALSSPAQSLETTAAKASTTAAPASVTAIVDAGVAFDAAPAVLTAPTAPTAPIAPVAPTAPTRPAARPPSKPVTLPRPPHPPPEAGVTNHAVSSDPPVFDRGD